ncbi:MAG: HAD family hydrolase [Deltaproteobacteria bacterium]|nr:HAD family hydrolase [Deltaproteobacteria bacterium]
MKLLLFDLDGTILHARHTAGRVPFDLAMRDVFGVDVSIGAMRPDGKTDPAIVAELLAMAGASPEVDAAALAAVERALSARFAETLAAGATTVEPVAGVRALLEAVAADPRFASAVLTGNLAGAAALKLRAAGLADFFAVGAFGSDHALRAALPDVARERFRHHSGRAVRREDCVILGDTPLDHAAAAANGMPAVLIATGRIPLAELAALRPAAAFADWSDGAAIHAALAALAERRDTA